MSTHPLLNRRAFLQSTLILSAAGVVAPHWSLSAEIPSDNPLKDLAPTWSQGLPWENTVNIQSLPGQGEFWDDRLEQAQRRLLQTGGGVVFFPAGSYRFQKDILLPNKIILRGEQPATRSAHEPAFGSPSRLEFPKYQPVFSGSGTPLDSAFKGILLQEPATASNCGVVNLSVNRGYISLGEAEGHRCGINRFVVGCLLLNSAGAATEIPNARENQPAWLRYTAKFRSAIRVHALENALVANNRIPKSGDDNFLIREFPLKDRKGEKVLFAVEFDYDNRPGIYVNHHCIGGAGGSGGDGTPETHPWGFRKGSVILDNYVYCNGRCAIGFSGDGVICSRNVIRFSPGIPRPTVTGVHASYGSATNDNRALEIRGWRWVVENNDYEVYSNICSDGKYKINDGEGLMHEDHCNSTIVDSRLVGNRGNSYLSLFHAGAVDGLWIEGNEISTPRKDSDIYVTAPRHKSSGDFPVRRVTIIKNITHSNGIRVLGWPAEKVVIKDNRHAGAKPGVILNGAEAELANNRNYEITVEPRRS